MNIITRPYQKSDDAFIYSTWTKNRWYSAGCKQKPMPDKSAWFKSTIAMIKEILENGPVFLACAEDDPNFMVGYIAGKNQEALWIYVKAKYRKQGIARLLKKRLESQAPSVSS